MLQLKIKEARIEDIVPVSKTLYLVTIQQNGFGVSVNISKNKLYQLSKICNAASIDALKGATVSAASKSSIISPIAIGEFIFKEQFIPISDSFDEIWSLTELIRHVRWTDPDFPESIEVLISDSE